MSAQPLSGNGLDKSGFDKSGSDSFFDLIRVPDRVAIYSEAQKDAVMLTRSGSRWQADSVEVKTERNAAALRIWLTAPSTAVRRIHLRWKLRPKSSLLYMGDAWERSYGDLSWRTAVPERVMPWYFAAHDDTSTHGYGVMTGAAAFCFWQVDGEGVSLWLDVSNGGMGVMLGQRELAAATVISRRGQHGERPIDSLTEFCRKLCPQPRLPKGPVYGTNDWYYAYGDNDAHGVLRDTELVVSLTAKNAPTPYSVIDGGWAGEGATNDVTVEGKGANPRFPDMAALAAAIAKRGALPGIWIRPMQAPKNAKPELLLSTARFRTKAEAEAGYDPTIPEAMELVLAKVRQVVGWNYKLVKHDFSTWDVLGQWGFAMGASPTIPGWSLHDRSRTNAEILLEMYKALRTTAGDDTLIVGCNTVGHLAAGVFEMNRIGDDTSGQRWERTRRMGVNTLAYRLPQNDTFFRIDPDCVGITKAIPWEMNRQWLSLIARSGAGLFVSPGPEATGPEQRAAIKEAFELAASNQTGGYASDWLAQTTPEDWNFRSGGAQHYDWCGENGCDPSPI